MNDFIVKVEKNKDKAKYFKINCLDCNIVLYKKKSNTSLTCGSCAAKRRHKLKLNKIKENIISSNGEIVLVKNGKKNILKYKSRCIECNSLRGYFKKSEINKKCRSCAQIGKVKTYEEKIKQSCIKQDIDINEFDGFKKTENQRDRVKFDKMGLAKSCFERYDYTCKRCHKRGGNLNAHHINNWSDYPDQRFDSNNLICLCEQCHIDFHLKFGYKNNNLDQLNEFTDQQTL